MSPTKKTAEPTTKATAKAGPERVALVGLNYQSGGGDVRIEAGEPVPAEVVARSPWLVEQHVVCERGCELPARQPHEPAPELATGGKVAAEDVPVVGDDGNRFGVADRSAGVEPGGDDE